MNLFIMIVVALLFLAGLIGIITFFLASKRKKKYSHEMAFAEALNYLVSGNKKVALGKLQTLVKNDTSNVAAYILIGDLFREMGQPQRAVKIHLDLTVRSELSTAQIQQIYRSLVLDYSDLGNYTGAIHYCDKLLALDKSDDWVKQKKLEFLESKKAWPEAYDLLHHNSHLFTREEYQQHLAYYKVQEGLRLVTEENEHDARVKFREALKIDRNYPDAFLSMADSYHRSSRPRDAIKWLRRLLETVPEKMDLASARIEKILIDIGNFGEVEKIYREILEKMPEAVPPRIALAKIYEKKGELRQAIQIYRDVLKINPDFNHVRFLMFRSLVRLGNEDAALKTAMEIVDDYLEQNL